MRFYSYTGQILPSLSQEGKGNAQRKELPPARRMMAVQGQGKSQTLSSLPYSSTWHFFNMKNMKIDFPHVWSTHVHNPRDLLWCQQGRPVARFKAICSTATAPVPGPAHLIRTLPWPTAQLWQPSFASASLWNRLQAKGIIQAVAGGFTAQPPVFQRPLLAGWAREDQRSRGPLAPAAELEVRRRSLSCWEHFIQPGLVWSLGKQQL